jgi:DNA-binding NarL/FixJ family response regulator
MGKIRVVLIEDHDLSRIGLCAALKQYGNIEIIGDAANATEGLQKIKVYKPDVAVVDIGLPDMDGIELTQRLKQSQSEIDTPQTKVLILTMHDSEDSVMAAFAAGADSYSLKDVSMDNLVQAIKTTYEGNAWIDPAIARIVLKQAKTSKPSQTTAPVVSDVSETQSIQAAGEEYQQMLETYPLTGERNLRWQKLIFALFK